MGFFQNLFGKKDKQKSLIGVMGFDYPGIALTTYTETERSGDLIVHFPAYIDFDSNFNEKRLRLEYRNHSEDYLMELIENLKEFTTVKVTGEFQGDTFVVSKFLGFNTKDSRFDEFIMELQQPIIYKSELFGELNFDKSIEVYNGSFLWFGKKIDISFPSDEFSIEEKVNSAKKNLFNEAFLNISSLLEKELVGLYNETWGEEGAESLTGEEMAQKLSLSNISFEGPKDIEFWYNAGEMFGDHAVVISGTSEGLQHAEIM